MCIFYTWQYARCRPCPGEHETCGGYTLVGPCEEKLSQGVCEKADGYTWITKYSGRCIRCDVDSRSIKFQNDHGITRTDSGVSLPVYETDWVDGRWVAVPPGTAVNQAWLDMEEAKRVQELESDVHPYARREESDDDDSKAELCIGRSEVETNDWGISFPELAGASSGRFGISDVVGGPPGRESTDGEWSHKRALSMAGCLAEEEKARKRAKKEMPTKVIRTILREILPKFDEATRMELEESNGCEYPVMGAADRGCQGFA